MRVQDLLSRLSRVRKTTERSWQATCPAHPAETPSLTVSLGEGGRILVHCHAGCSAESVVEAVDLGDPIARYIDILREEIGQRRAILRTKDEVDPINSRDSEAIGFRDEQFGYLFPTVARKRVSMCLRAAGESWNVTAQTLNRGLVKKKIVIPGPENRAETKRRFNGERFRVLMIPLSVLRDQPPPPAAPDSAPAGPAANGRGPPATPKPPGLTEASTRRPLLPSRPRIPPLFPRKCSRGVQALASGRS